jgi:peptide deformylase
MVRPINSGFIEDQKKILKTRCIAVDEITPEITALIADLIDTAAGSPGCVGLSSNQIWDDPAHPAPRICLLPGQVGWVVAINPLIDMKWNKTLVDSEGCMSLPKYVDKKKARSKHIRVSYMNEKLELTENVELFDMPARIFQHEMDHLDGKLLNG